MPWGGGGVSVAGAERYAWAFRGLPWSGDGRERGAVAVDTRTFL